MAEGNALQWGVPAIWTLVDVRCAPPQLILGEGCSGSRQGGKRDSVERSNSARKEIGVILIAWWKWMPDAPWVSLARFRVLHQGRRGDLSLR